jgi:glutamate/tyrosine decarboxylase-like PLP-dependent enzyme
VAIDGHKWLFAPVEAGCILVRDRKLMRDTFSYRPPYYSFHDHTDEEEPVNFHEYGPQNSRAFRALKLWLTMSQAGRSSYQQTIAANIDLAAALARLLQDEPDFEVATRSLSITTFRYVPVDLDPTSASNRDYLNRLNRAVMEAVQRGGKAYLSNALVDSVFYLRTCITNFRSSEADVRALPGIVREQGHRLHRLLRQDALKSPLL